MAEKWYWFSFQKHGHDIEYRRNKLFCAIQDGEEDQNGKLQKEYEALTEILLLQRGPTSKIPGRLYGYAKNAILWAGNARADLYQG